MRTTGGPRLPWVVAVVVLGTFALTAVLFTIDLSFGLMSGSAIASMTLVGALLMTRAAGNLVGGLLLAAGVLLTAAVVMGTYAEAGLAGSAPPPTSVGIAFVLNDALFVPPMVMLLIGVPLFFPDGHLLSRRWRAVVWLTAAAIAATTVCKLFTPQLAGTDLMVNPIGIPGLEPVLRLLNLFSLLTAPIGFGAAVAAIAIRFRRGRGIERQQLKWFLAVAGTCAIAFVIGILPLAPDIQNTAFLVAFCGLIAMPIAIGVAILRYRLYEIDRLVSRTIAYALVTGGLVAVYLGVNLVLTTVLSTLASGNSVAVAASTLVVAALFTPARRRVQHVVDRRFDRARYDGERTTAAFSARLRDEVDIATVVADLDGTVRSALRPSHVGLWLRVGGR